MNYNDPVQLLFDVHQYLNRRRDKADEDAKQLRIACEGFLVAFDPNQEGGHAVAGRASLERFLEAYDLLDSLGQIIECECDEFPDAEMCGDHRRDEGAEAEVRAALAWSP